MCVLASFTMGRPKKESADPAFSWTDEETELLIDVVKEYKKEKEVEGASSGNNVYWDSCHSKYQDIGKKFIMLYDDKQAIGAKGIFAFYFASVFNFSL